MVEECFRLPPGLSDHPRYHLTHLLNPQVFNLTRSHFRGTTMHGVSLLLIYCRRYEFLRLALAISPLNSVA